MNIKKLIDTTEHKNGSTCVVREYDTESTEINTALVIVKGRYPETGSVLNTEVSEMVYVVSGKGSVSVEGMSTHIEKGDCILIHPHEKFYWEGELELIVTCIPSWNPEQYKHYE